MSATEKLLHKISHFLRSIFLGVAFEKHQGQVKHDYQDNLTTVFLSVAGAIARGANGLKFSPLTLNLTSKYNPVI